MIAPARVAANEVLQRIEMERAHSDDALHSGTIDGLDPRDRNLATEIVYGTLRWQSWLDYAVETAVARDFARVDQKTKILLRLSTYQLARMDRLPDHAVIHDAVELAKQHLRRNASGFVNGVLRSLARQRPWKTPEFHRDCPLWTRVSLPRWLWERWQSRFGSDLACEFALSLNRKPCRAVRKRRDVQEDGMIPSDLVPGAYLCDDGKPEAEGWHYQDEGSQLVPFLLNPGEGDLVWDACAAPGGKSAILLEMCGPGGLVVSSDLDQGRVRTMSEAMRAENEAKCALLVADACKPSPFNARFHGVLADVPCSGLGTLRRNPEIKWRMREEWLPRLQSKQRTILDAVSEAVRPGGKLLYSTCSTEPEENEAVVYGFLASHPEFRIVRPGYPKGVDSWLDSNGLFRSFPTARLWDGFFAALMVRREA